MSRLSWWQRIIFGLTFLLPLACNLTTVDPTAIPFPTATATIFKPATTTPKASSTAPATATNKPAQPPKPTATPVFNLVQAFPAPVCSVVPSVTAANIRSGAGTNFPVIGTIFVGNWVMASRLTNSGWYQIVALGTVVNGGWISNTVMTLQQPCVCTPDTCTQSGIVPPTAAPSALPRVGFVGLTPSGAAPCIVTGGDADVPIFSVPEGDPPIIATLIPNGGLSAFDFRAGRWAVNFTVGSQQLVGWVNGNRVTVAGDCDKLRVPPVCSVQAPIGGMAEVYAEPKRDARVITTMNEYLPLPFIQKNADGWFNVDVGASGNGWVAPDEGVLVGPC
ncbi:MAG: hypothetical protein ABI970_12835 [Chloroflexota bacterium]